MEANIDNQSKSLSDTENETKIKILPCTDFSPNKIEE
jgi:hypothetical protein